MRMNSPHWKIDDGVNVASQLILYDIGGRSPK